MPKEGSYPPPAPYPLFVRLDGERVVVVGAGAVAARKVETMLEYGARVTVVAPEACEAVCGHARDGRVELACRRYREGDLDGAMLAVVATSDADVNRSVYEEARRRGVLVNVVDVPELCTCIVPSIMRRGQLQVAVSTNGASPGVARDIRRGLEQRFEPWWEDYIDMLAELRVLVKERVAGGAQERAPLFEAVAAAGLERRFAAGGRPDARDVFAEVVAPLVEGGAGT